LLLVSVLAQVIAATVIGLAVVLFFVLLGLFSVSVPVITSWIGHAPRVLVHFTLAGHEYSLTSELLRVSAFLGTFAGFYFIVSSTTDQRMRQSATVHHQDHLRAVLAVRSVYRCLESSAAPDVDRTRPAGPVT
jgi:protein-S-isoprenylcysteine O-methyltransferase Ste14